MVTQYSISGAWNTYIHAGPDVADRKHNIVELARRTADAKMGGLVLKNQHALTTIAAMFDRIIADIEATGPKHNLLWTDYGQPGRISPPDALAAFHENLETTSTPSENVKQMSCDDPKRLSGGA